MNLYYISQNVNNNYDTYDSAVVAAENEEEARRILPTGDIANADYSGDHQWCHIKDVDVELIGAAADSITIPTVICASFNAA